jgi:hypothetical protein
VPIQFVPEKEKETTKKPVAGKLTILMNGTSVPNYTTAYQPIFHHGAVEQYFQWIGYLQNIMSSYTVQEKYAMVLKTLKGSVGELLLAKCNTASPVLADQAVTKIDKDALFITSIDAL